MIIEYNKILKKNLENVLKEVLKIISNEGLKKGHHLFITFDPNNKGTKIPLWLKKQRPEIMTIVIQYEYWDLIIRKEDFSIRLSFNDIKTKITISFNSVVSFADPYANFGLKIQDKELKKIKKRNKIKKSDSDKIIKFENYLKN